MSNERILTRRQERELDFILSHDFFRNAANANFSGWWNWIPLTRSDACFWSFIFAVLLVAATSIMVISGFSDGWYESKFSTIYTLIIVFFFTLAFILTLLVITLYCNLDIKLGYAWFVRTVDDVLWINGIRRRESSSSSLEDEAGISRNPSVETISTICRSEENVKVHTETSPYNLRSLSSRRQSQPTILSVRNLESVSEQHQAIQSEQVIPLNPQSGEPRNPNLITREERLGEVARQSNKITPVVTYIDGQVHIHGHGRSQVRRRQRAQSQPSVSCERLHLATEKQQVTQSEQCIPLDLPQQNLRSSNRPETRFGKITRRQTKITHVVTKGVVHAQEQQQVRRHTRSTSARSQEANILPGQIPEEGQATSGRNLRPRN